MSRMAKILVAILLAVVPVCGMAQGNAGASNARTWWWTGTSWVPSSSANPLPVAIISGAGSGGTAMTDEGAFTQGTTSFTPAGCFYNASPTNLLSGQAGALLCTQTRHAMVSCDNCSSSSFTDNSAFTAGSTSIGILGGWYSTSPTACTSGDACAANLTSDRKLFVQGFQGTSPWVVSASGNFGVTQQTSPWVDNLTQWNSVALGSPSAYGTSPGAVNVPGVNAFVTNIPAVTQSGTWSTRTQDGSGNPITSNSTTTTSTEGLDVNIRSILNTAPSTAGKLDVKGADGDVFVRQTSGANLHVNVDSAPTTAVTESGTWTNRIVGNAGGTLDAATNGANPGNQLWNVPAPSTAATAAATSFEADAVTTASTVKASAGNLYGYLVTNPNASFCYFEVFNTTTPTLGTTAPIISIGIPANGAANLSLTYPISFSTAIAVASTTASKGASTCGTGMPMTVIYE